MQQTWRTRKLSRGHNQQTRLIRFAWLSCHPIARGRVNSRKVSAVATLGFTAIDFEVFKVEGFSERMQQIYEHVRPKLIRLGDELAPELARRLHMEFFPHVAKH